MMVPLIAEDDVDDLVHVGDIHLVVLVDVTFQAFRGLAGCNAKDGNADDLSQ